MHKIIKNDSIVALFPDSKIEFKEISTWCRRNFGKCRDYRTSKWYVCSDIEIDGIYHVAKHRCVIIRDKESFLITILTWHS